MSVVEGLGVVGLVGVGVGVVSVDQMRILETEARVARRRGAEDAAAPQAQNGLVGQPATAASTGSQDRQTCNQSVKQSSQSDIQVP